MSNPAVLSLSAFADRLSAILPVIMKEFAKRQMNELYKGKITLPQFFILEFLSREGPANMGSLAHAMSVTTAAMTGLVERLVREGYVKRDSEPDDRRVIKIALTAQGESLVRKVNDERHKMAINIFGKISASDRSEYLRILMQIKDVLMQKGARKEK